MDKTSSNLPTRKHSTTGINRELATVAYVCSIEEFATPALGAETHVLELDQNGDGVIIIQLKERNPIFAQGCSFKRSCRSDSHSKVCNFITIRCTGLVVETLPEALYEDRVVSYAPRTFFGCH